MLNILAITYTFEFCFVKTKLRKFIRGAFLTAITLLVIPGSPHIARSDIVINNNIGATGTSNFTQSETSLLVFGSTILAAFNDSGSNAGGATQFTGYARSTNGGTTWIDLGTLPSVGFGGDGGDPVFARNTTNGFTYLATLPFTSSGVQFFKSTDGFITIASPINATPGRTNADRNNLSVDNFAGPGQGNVYLAARTFDAGNGIFFFRSTENGTTFGPNGGTLIASGAGNNVQNPWVAVGSDHSVDVFYLNDPLSNPQILLRKSTDGGLTFGPSITVATLSSTLGINGDLGLTGIRNGTFTPVSFRTPDTFQAVTNPVTGQMYLVYHNVGAGTDRGDIFLVTSQDGGFTWSAPVRVNTDATLNDQWQPTLAVTPDGTKLGIFWYDRRLDPNNNLIDYFGRTCTITGFTLTCGADYRISDVSFLPEFGRDFVVNSTYMGDYDIAQADNLFFYVAWGDNLLPLAGGDGRMDPNVFFDRVSTANTAIPEPSTLLLLGIGLIAVGTRFRRGLSL